MPRQCPLNEVLHKPDKLSSDTSNLNELLQSHERTAGEPSKQKLPEQIHQNACHLGILPVTFHCEFLLFFIFLGYWHIFSCLPPFAPFFLPPSIPLSLSSSFQQTSFSLFSPFLPPSLLLPSPVCPLPLYIPVPLSAHYCCDSIFYCCPPDSLRLQVSCIANLHPLLDSSKENGISLLDLTAFNVFFLGPR